MTAKGDVGRSTYFRYFKNKDEVLTFKILCMFEDELEQRGLNIKTIPDDQFVNEVFDFFPDIRISSSALIRLGIDQSFLIFS